MAKAEYSQTVDVTPDHFFTTITDYASYPKFVDGCKRVEVKRESDSLARVTYFVSMMKDVTYTLEQTEDRAAGRMTWKLIESDTLKANTGSWTLKTAAGGAKTDVTYAIDIEFAISVPSFILSKLIKTSLPSMVRGFEKQAKSTLSAAKG